MDGWVGGWLVRLGGRQTLVRVLQLYYVLFVFVGKKAFIIKRILLFFSLSLFIHITLPCITKQFCSFPPVTPWLQLRSACRFCFLSFSWRMRLKQTVICVLCVEERFVNSKMLLCAVLIQTRRSTEESSDAGEGEGGKRRQSSSLRSWPYRGAASTTFLIKTSNRLFLIYLFFSINFLN